MPEQTPGLDERSRGNTVARENAIAEPDSEETAGKRRRKRKRSEATELRRSACLHQE